MSHKHEKPEKFELDQSSDFATFVIDGKDVEVDIYQVNDKLVEIDRRHLDDLTECEDCLKAWPPRINGETLTKCPGCDSEKLRPSQDFLDDVAKLVCGYGPKRCSRKLAAYFYDKVLGCIGGLKKNTNSTPESPSGSTATTPENSPSATSEPI